MKLNLRIAMTAALSALVLLAPLAASASAEKAPRASEAKATIAPRIIDGTLTTNRQWPFLVGIAHREDSRGKPIRSAFWGQGCGGVLLTRTWVLTAGHCIPLFSTGTDFDILVGRTDLKKANQGERVGGYAFDRPNHKNIANAFSEWDFALIRLQRPARRGKPLGLGRLGRAVPGGELARIAGWGIDRDYVPHLLQEGRVPVLPDSECQAAYPLGEMLEFVHQNMLCAGHPEGGQDTCQGDSGGPLMQNGMLVGIVSWGEGCGEAGYPGVYAKVSSVIPWIKKTVKKTYREKRPGQFRVTKPIREVPGWTPRRVIEWGIETYGPVSSPCQHIGGTMCWGFVKTRVSANRPVSGASLMSEPAGDTALCAYQEVLATYEREDCFSEPRAELQGEDGGWSAYWEGLALHEPYLRDYCRRFTLRATISGQVRFQSLYPCSNEAAEIITTRGAITRPTISEHGVGLSTTVRQIG